MARLPISVRTMLLCEKAKKRNGIWTLHNPLGSILIVPGDEMESSISLFLFAQLTGGAGTYNLAVKVRAFDSTFELGRSQTVPVRFPSERDMTVENLFRFDRLTIPRSELYEFQLFANHVEVDGGTAYLSVIVEEKS